MPTQKNTQTSLEILLCTCTFTQKNFKYLSNNSLVISKKFTHYLIYKFFELNSTLSMQWISTDKVKLTQRRPRRNDFSFCHYYKRYCLIKLNL